ncbi:NADP-dependent oxidoreductase domain-containing protein [Trichoderma longibrachiatum]|uniref:Aldo/keto reductase n=1 Tax=Trichoderma longibrachiatum ATCC 18648 TaxID=983965 RepID=A0A2T4CK08_TRILO|nr:Aldo/keto reductase [Trichoderma longibrachiatum ATCC 18648]
MSLPTRRLGTDGPLVTAIGFGAMGISAFYGSTEPDEQRLKVLDHLYETGERFWDTANVYGDSEELIGKWFERNPEKRKDIVLATKFGNRGPNTPNNDPEYARQCCEESLKRLKTDYIDLYYVHRVDSNTPIEKTIRGMVELKKKGWIRYLGLSEVSADTLRRAHAVHPIAAVQMEYSPFALEIEMPETNLLNTCKELGVAVVAYAPLGRGILTGQIKSPDDFEEGDFRRNIPRFSRENFPKTLELVTTLQEIAARHNATSAQLVLAWLLKQWDMVIPIPGTKKIKYYDENMGALRLTVSDEENDEIRRAIDKASIAGDRYPPGWAAGLFVTTVPLEE